MLSGTAQAQTISLPLEVQLDIAVAELARAMEAANHAEVLAVVARIRAIDPAADAVSDILFFEAEAALALNEVDRGEQALARFLSLRGRDSASYENAIELLLEMPVYREREERLAEEARRRREQEEAARREREAEQARRAQEAAQREEARRLLDAESRLALSSRDFAHIRLVLHARFSDRRQTQEFTGSLSTREREHIRMFARGIGQSPTGYLDRSLADALLRERAEPIQPDYSVDRQFRKRQRIGAWNALVERDGSCAIESVGRQLGDAVIIQAPVLRLSYDADWGVTAFGFDFAVPNPFGNQAVTARLGTRNFPLALDGSALQPLVTTDGASYDYGIVRAMTSADEIDISGRNRLYGDNLTIRFALDGFREAVRFMEIECGDPGLGALLGNAGARDAAQTDRAHSPAAELDDGWCMIVVASRRNTGEVALFMRELAPAVRDRTRVFLSTNGWYAISTGAVPRADAAEIIAGEVRRDEIPADSFCSGGESFTLEVPRREYVVVPSSNFSATHRITSPRTGYLNLRIGPGTSHGIVRRLPHESVVQVTSVRLEDWLTVITPDGLRGWVHGSFLESR